MKKPLILLVLITACFCTGCALFQSKPVSIVILASNQFKKAPLDLKFSQVYFRNKPLPSAALALESGIIYSPEKIAHPNEIPSVGISAIISTDRVLKDSEIPKVTYCGKNVTLKEVMDALSVQSGWPYEDAGWTYQFFSPAYKRLRNNSRNQ